jgi:hypothetical protein
MRIMRHLILFCFAALFTCTATAQDFQGQWKGSFTAYGSAEQDEYVLELQITNKTQVSGYSYTYFYQNNKRYFTICRITGTVDRTAKMITVTEVEKIKGDVPPGEFDCLQVHTLTYFKGDEGETLEGKWKPAPGFDRGCGFGTTVLSRKLLAKTPSVVTRKPTFHKPDSASRRPVNKPPVATTKPAGAGAAKPAVAGAAKPAGTGAAKPAVAGAAKPAGTGAAKPAGAGAAKPAAATTKPALASRDTNALKMAPNLATQTPPPVVVHINPPPAQVRARTNNIIQTVELDSPEIRIELYDDGIIDHDTVTVYFNGKAVIYQNMLTHSPIKATLRALPGVDNDLILFADNLGDIPPNTALMVVYAGEEKYDIRVTSDLQTNGVVRFKLKSPAK